MDTPEFYPLIQRIIDTGRCTVEPDYHGLGAVHYDLIQDWDGDVDYYLEWAERQGGPVLELGAGTGRVGIPLARAGHGVTCVDASEDMLAVLEAKLASEPVAVRSRVSAVRADVRDLELGGEFPLAIMPLYTLVHMASPADRRRVFESAGSHLAPGGVLVLEVELDRGGRDLRRDEAPVLTAVRHDRDRDILVLELSQIRPVPGSASSLLLNLLKVVVDAEGRVSLGATSSVENLVSEEELRALTREVGLELEGLYRGYAGDPLRASDSSAVVVARKGR